MVLRETKIILKFLKISGTLRTTQDILAYFKNSGRLKSVLIFIKNLRIVIRSRKITYFFSRSMRSIDPVKMFNCFIYPI